MTQRLLFLCTGNYYRSRFAEIVFNTLADELGLDWIADSRGLALEKGENNVGPMCPVAVAALKTLGIMSAGFSRYPRQVQERDLQEADLIIALHEIEHRPYLTQRYPAWPERVTYWRIRDVDPTQDYNPLRQIELELRRLITRQLTSAM